MWNVTLNNALQRRKSLGQSLLTFCCLRFRFCVERFCTSAQTFENFHIIASVLHDVDALLCIRCAHFSPHHFAITIDGINLQLCCAALSISSCAAPPRCFLRIRKLSECTFKASPLITPCLWAPFSHFALIDIPYCAFIFAVPAIAVFQWRCCIIYAQCFFLAIPSQFHTFMFLNAPQSLSSISVLHIKLLKLFLFTLFPRSELFVDVLNRFVPMRAVLKNACYSFRSLTKKKKSHAWTVRSLRGVLNFEDFYTVPSHDMIVQDSFMWGRWRGMLEKSKSRRGGTLWFHGRQTCYKLESPNR